MAWLQAKSQAKCHGLKLALAWLWNSEAKAKSQKAMALDEYIINNLHYIIVVYTSKFLLENVLNLIVISDHVSLFLEIILFICGRPQSEDVHIPYSNPLKY
jgi:hypothetical protein